MRFHHRINLNLLNQPQIIGTYRIELINQVIRLLVRCRITQTTQRIQICQRRAARLGLKILRLIDNHNRMRRLNELNRRNPLLAHLIDHHAIARERIGSPRLRMMALAATLLAWAWAAFMLIRFMVTALSVTPAPSAVTIQSSRAGE